MISNINNNSMTIISPEYTYPLLLSSSFLAFLIFKYINYSKGPAVNRSSNLSSFFGSTSILKNDLSTLQEHDVPASVLEYKHLFSGARDSVGQISTTESIALRKKEYESLVGKFYDLVTDFYEYGWGQSFHFAPRFIAESFTASIARAEHFLALKLQLKTNDHVLDLGCGVGGPMRTISRFANVKITGITINEYQVKVGNRYNETMGFNDTTCIVKQGDFMKLPFSDNVYDAMYAIEATCHAPDKTKCFMEAFRVLKPGGYFAGYEWMMVGNFDASNPNHTKLKEGIEVGNGLPTLETPAMLLKALGAAGFEIIEHYDANENGNSSAFELPWYSTLDGSFSLSGFRMSKMGLRFTHAAVTLLEMCKIAPKGSVQVHEILKATANDLVNAGKLGIMTPSYYFLVRKPLE